MFYILPSVYSLSVSVTPDLLFRFIVAFAPEINLIIIYMNGTIHSVKFIINYYKAWPLSFLIIRLLLSTLLSSRDDGINAQNTSERFSCHER